MESDATENEAVENPGTENEASVITALAEAPPGNTEVTSPAGEMTPALTEITSSVREGISDVGEDAETVLSPTVNESFASVEPQNEAAEHGDSVDFNQLLQEEGFPVTSPDDKPELETVGSQQGILQEEGFPVTLLTSLDDKPETVVSQQGILSEEGFPVTLLTSLDDKPELESVVSQAGILRSSSTSSRRLRSLLSELMACPLCLECAEKARLLPCQHTFCVRCLEEYDRRERIEGVLQCPVCRAPCRLTATAVADLPPNIFLNTLRDAVKMEEEGSEGQMSGGQTPPVLQCSGEGCEEAAQQYCTQGCKYLCTACTAIHSKVPFTRGHQVVNCEQASDNQRNQLPPCNRHSHQLLDLFCEDCTLPCCATCFALDHCGHHCCELTAKMVDYQHQLEKVMSQAESHLRAINTAIQVTQCQVSAGREQVLKLKQRVSGLYGKLHARLEVEERGLNRQLEQAYQQAHKAAAEVADRQQLLQASMESVQLCGSQLKVKGTPYDYMTNVPALLRRVMKQSCHPPPEMRWSTNIYWMEPVVGGSLGGATNVEVLVTAEGVQVESGPSSPRDVCMIQQGAIQQAREGVQQQALNGIQQQIPKGSQNDLSQQISVSTQQVNSGLTQIQKESLQKQADAELTKQVRDSLSRQTTGTAQPIKVGVQQKPTGNLPQQVREGSCRPTEQVRVCLPQTTATGVPQQVLCVPQQVMGVPQQVSGVPQQVLSVPQQVPCVPQQVPGVPQQITGVPQQVPGVHQQVTGVPPPQQVPSVPPQIPGWPQLPPPQGAMIHGVITGALEKIQSARESSEHERATLPPDNNPTVINDNDKEKAPNDSLDFDDDDLFKMETESSPLLWSEQCPEPPVEEGNCGEVAEPTAQGVQQQHLENQPQYDEPHKYTNEIQQCTDELQRYTGEIKNYPGENLQCGNENQQCPTQIPQYNNESQQYTGESEQSSQQYASEQYTDESREFAIENQQHRGETPRVKSSLSTSYIDLQKQEEVRGIVVHKGYVFVVHFHHDRIYVYREDGTFITNTRVMGMRSPYGLTMVQSDGQRYHLVVSDCKSNCLWWIEIAEVPETLLKLGQCGSTRKGGMVTLDQIHQQVLDYSPLGISSTLSGHALVTDHSNSRLYMYSHPGLTIRHLQLPLYAKPTLAVSLPDGRHVAMCGTKYLLWLAHTGELMHNQHMPAETTSYSICVSGRSCLAADWNNHMLYQAIAGGGRSHMRCLLGPKHGLMAPSRMYVNPADGKLWVGHISPVTNRSQLICFLRKSIQDSAAVNPPIRCPQANSANDSYSGALREGLMGEEIHKKKITISISDMAEREHREPVTDNSTDCQGGHCSQAFHLGEGLPSHQPNVTLYSSSSKLGDQHPPQTPNATLFSSSGLGEHTPPPRTHDRLSISSEGLPNMPHITSIKLNFKLQP